MSVAGLPASMAAGDLRPAHRSWSRWLIPSFADCLAVALLIWLFASGPFGWAGLLSDGDTGWHIRTGEFILDHHRVPTVDLFSFTKPGQPWFAWEWLSGVVMAVLYRMSGLKGVVLWGAVMIIAFAAILFRHMIWRGANLFAALLITLLGVGAASLHYLARPHLFTLVLLPACLWLVECDRRERTRRIWVLVPVTALWVNLHGGFLALVSCLGILTVGSLIERKFEDVKRYGLLTFLCGAVSIVNPYGYQLHLHLVEYLGSDWIKKAVVEFRSPSFRDENVMQFELLMFLGLAVAGLMVARRRYVEPIWILFWAHQALISARHITVFVTVATPIIAVELSRYWDRWVSTAPRRSFAGILDSLARERVAGCRWNSLWVVVPVIALAMLDGRAVSWPVDFPDRLFPVSLIARHEATISGGRVFTADDWADYLIFRNYPRQRVFFDGRSDFYGAALGDEYIRMSLGHYDWNALLSKHHIDVVLSPVEWSLASLLKSRSDWKLLEDNGKALLFVRR